MHTIGHVLEGRISGGVAISWLVPVTAQASIKYRSSIWQANH